MKHICINVVNDKRNLKSLVEIKNNINITKTIDSN